MFRVVMILIVAFFSIAARLPGKISDAQRKILLGTNDVTAYVNKELDREGRIRFTDANFARLRDTILVPLPETAGLCINKSQVLEKFRYVLPQTRRYLIQLGRDNAVQFPDAPLCFNSAVRTPQHQLDERRIRKNPNAIGVVGWNASAHLSGAPVDIQIIHMLPKQWDWFVKRMVTNEIDRCIDATLENSSRTMMHVTVFASCFVPPMPKGFHAPAVVHHTKKPSSAKHSSSHKKKGSQSVVRKPGV